MINRSKPSPLFALPLLLALSSCSWLGMEEWSPNFDGWFAPSKGNAVDEKALAELNKFPYILMAPDAPPPPKNEIRSPVPTPREQYDWRPGHWTYEDGKGFIWNGGGWIKKPAFTAVWKPDFWVQHTYGWALVPGHWE